MHDHVSINVYVLISVSINGGVCEPADRLRDKRPTAYLLIYLFIYLSASMYVDC